METLQIESGSLKDNLILQCMWTFSATLIAEDVKFENLPVHQHVMLPSISILQPFTYILTGPFLLHWLQNCDFVFLGTVVPLF